MRLEVALVRVKFRLFLSVNEALELFSGSHFHVSTPNFADSCIYLRFHQYHKSVTHRFKSMVWRNSTRADSMKRHGVFKMKYQITRPNIPSNMSEFLWNLKIPFLPAAACLNITSIAAILLSRHVDITFLYFWKAMLWSTVTQRSVESTGLQPLNRLNVRVYSHLQVVTGFLTV